MADDGNRQVAVTLSVNDVSLNSVQFEALGTQLSGINGAVNKLAENIAEPDTSVAAEIQSLKEVVSVGFNDVRQSITDLNNTIFDASNNLAKWLAAIALAAANPADNTAEVQKKVDELTALLKPEADAFEDAATKEGE